MGRTLDITSYTLEDRDTLSDQETSPATRWRTGTRSPTRRRFTNIPGSGTTWSGGRWSAWPRPD